jgi:hypothetical protein
MGKPLEYRGYREIHALLGMQRRGYRDPSLRSGVNQKTIGVPSAARDMLLVVHLVKSRFLAALRNDKPSGPMPLGISEKSRFLAALRNDKPSGPTPLGISEKSRFLAALGMTSPIRNDKPYVVNVARDFRKRA